MTQILNALGIHFDVNNLNADLCLYVSDTPHP